MWESMGKRLLVSTRTTGGQLFRSRKPNVLCVWESVFLPVIPDARYAALDLLIGHDWPAGHGLEMLSSHRGKRNLPFLVHRAAAGWGEGS